jgi:hypothetical protein
MHNTSTTRTACFLTLMAVFAAISTFAQTTLLYDGFESRNVSFGTSTNEFATTNWFDFDPDAEDAAPTEGWGMVTNSFGSSSGKGVHSGKNKLYCSGLGNGGPGYFGSTAAPIYSDNSGISSQRRSVGRAIDLRGCSSANLSFWYKDLVPIQEYGEDFFSVYLDDDFSPIWSTTDFSPTGEDIDPLVRTWTRQVIPIPEEYMGAVHVLRFEFEFTENNAVHEDPDDELPLETDYEGVYLDDVLVTATKNAYLPDFDRDGSTDIVSQNTNGTLAVWYLDLGNPTNAVKKADLVKNLAGATKVLGAGWKTVGNVDFDKNGVSDLLFWNSNGSMAAWLMTNSYLTNIIVLTNGTRFTNVVEGPVKFQRGINLRAAGADWRPASVTDLNNDGERDFIFQNIRDGRMAAWYMSGTNRTSSGLIAGGAPITAGYTLVGTADFNLDGQKDLLLQKGTDGSFSVWTLQGLTLLAKTFAIRAGAGAVFSKDWKVVSLNDFDNDGNVDLVVQHTDGRIAIWYLNPDPVTGVTTGMRIGRVQQIKKIGVGWRVVGLK